MHEFLAGLSERALAQGCEQTLLYPPQPASPYFRLKGRLNSVQLDASGARPLDGRDHPLFLEWDRRGSRRWRLGLPPIFAASALIVRQPTSVRDRLCWSRSTTSLQLITSAASRPPLRACRNEPHRRRYSAYRFQSGPTGQGRAVGRLMVISAASGTEFTNLIVRTLYILIQKKVPFLSILADPSNSPTSPTRLQGRLRNSGSYLVRPSQLLVGPTWIQAAERAQRFSQDLI